MILSYIPIFLLGLIVGSFLNSVIFRLGKESFLKGRSYCPHCGHQLDWKDLIPLVSFFALKGRCRYCGRRISWQYPLVEFSTALLFVLIFHLTQGFLWVNLPLTLFWLVIGSSMLVIFVYDFKNYVIPNSVLVAMLIVILIWYSLGTFLNYYDGIQLLVRFLSGLGAAAPLLLIVLISQGKWMGMGDVKLTFVIGLLLGWPEIAVAMFFAFMIGGIMGTALLLTGQKEMKSKIALGPLLIIGALIGWAWGQQILSWYLSYLYHV